MLIANVSQYHMQKDNVETNEKNEIHSQCVKHCGVFPNKMRHFLSMLNHIWRTISILLGLPLVVLIAKPINW